MIPPEEFEQLLTAAREGSQSAVGRLLESYRRYLLVIANVGLTADLWAKVGGSDLVQQTLTEAYEAIDHFRGSTEEELKGWLQRILKCNLADAERMYLQAASRDVRRERSIEDSGMLDRLPDGNKSPSSEIANVEEFRRLDAALTRLPAEYRQVIELRNRDQLRFAEIGEKMNRSADAARMLWNRAVEFLQAELEVG